MSNVAKLRTFLVDDTLWDVTQDLPGDLMDADLPITYTVDWNANTKLVFHAPKVGMHFDVLLAALDHLEACNQLPLEQAIVLPEQIIEV